MKRKLFIEKITPYFYVFPVLVIFGVFSVYPIIRTFFLSFTDAGIVINKLKFVGLENYFSLFRDRYFIIIIINTFIYSFFTVLLTIVFGLLGSAIANSKSVRITSLFRLASFYPYVLPTAVAAMIWIYMYNPTRGIINLLLGERIQWLSSYEYALPALIIVAVWKSLGFNFILFLSGMQNISKEFYEAALLETNNPIKIYFKITLPLLSPTLFLVVLLSVTSSFQNMDMIALMTSGGPGNATNVIMYYVYQQGIINARVGYASAVSSLLLLFLFVFTIVYLTKGEQLVKYER